MKFSGFDIVPSVLHGGSSFLLVFKVNGSFSTSYVALNDDYAQLT